MNFGRLVFNNSNLGYKDSVNSVSCSSPGIQGPPSRDQQHFESRIQEIIPVNNSSASSNSSNLENTIKGPNHELWQARVQQFESGIQRQCEFCLLLLARNPGTTTKGPATFRIQDTRNNSTPPRGQQQFGSRIQEIIPINNSSASSNSSNLENTIKGPNHELWQARVQQFESGIQRQCEFCLLLLARNPGTTIKGPATFRI